MNSEDKDAVLYLADNTEWNAWLIQLTTCDIYFNCHYFPHVHFRSGCVNVSRTHVAGHVKPAAPCTTNSHGNLVPMNMVPYAKVNVVPLEN